MRIAIPNPAEQERRVREWNAKHPLGTPVEVTLDNGNLKETRTSSKAWVLSGHTAVIMLEDIGGCYALHRVHPIPESTAKI